MTNDELRQLLTYGARFWEYAPYKDKFDYNPQTVERLLREMEQNHYLNWIKDGEKIVAFIGVLVHPMLFNSEVVAGTEVFFYADPAYRGGGAGKELLAATEKDLKEAGVDILSLSDMTTSMDMAAFYTAEGYSLSERSYTKEL